MRQQKGFKRAQKVAVRKSKLATKAKAKAERRVERLAELAAKAEQSKV